MILTEYSDTCAFILLTLKQRVFEKLSDEAVFAKQWFCNSWPVRDGVVTKM
jgi:hypothetical protein